MARTRLQRAKRQTENLFETYWQVYPWRPAGNEPIQDKEYQRFLDVHKPYLGDRYDDQTQKILEVYAKEDRQDGGQYAPNIGAIYSDLYYITEKVLGSRKGLRNFTQVDETGEKSTLGGDRACLYDGVDNLQTNQAEDFEVQFGKQKAGYVWLEFIKGDRNSRQLLATMGHQAEASTGIAIAYYKNPFP
jgi:CRISPR-associated protein Cmr2